MVPCLASVLAFPRLVLRCLVPAASHVTDSTPRAAARSSRQLLALPAERAEEQVAAPLHVGGRRRADHEQQQQQQSSSSGGGSRGRRRRRLVPDSSTFPCTRVLVRVLSQQALALRLGSSSKRSTTSSTTHGESAAGLRLRLSTRHAARRTDTSREPAGTARDRARRPDRARREPGRRAGTVARWLEKASV